MLDWDEGNVHLWLTTLGLPQYENQIRQHRVSGDVLSLMDAESLKEIGIETIGQRLAILKAVYQLKLVQQIPIDTDDYVPPSEVEGRQEHMNVDRMYELLKEQGDRLRNLEEENRRLCDSMNSCLEDISNLRTSQPTKIVEVESPVNRAPSFKWASFVKAGRSPTKASTVETIVETPQSSPQRAEHDTGASSSRVGLPSASDKQRIANAGPSSQNLTSSQPRPSRQDSSDNLKSFKVSLDDPAWKVLPAALKKYKINNDDWQNYAMFICYGSPGNRIERCLSYDEKPLLLFQKLKDAKKNPVFMLKHIKDIRSPIAVAQQKQAARKASSETSSVKSPPLTGASTSSHGQSSHASQPSHDRIHPPKLQVNSHVGSAAPQIMTGGPHAQSGWPEIMSPAVESKDRADDLESSRSQSTYSGTTVVSTAESDTTTVASVREIPPSTGVSYAVAIYPYMAEQDDEFDVVVGDTFIILSRARGWWVVQRDPAGSGQVEPDSSKQGWVPAGCLLETSVPVAAAIAEATSKGGASSPTIIPGSTPILPLSILSTSFPGIALMDYTKKGDEELTLAKDDSLRVFKRYNHWSYAVKEESGDRGWVPSWFIGKVPTVPGGPATPSSSAPPHAIPLEGDVSVTSVQQVQVSPMSSAFPPLQAQPRMNTGYVL
ncbi:hypothetical protein PHLGIDRAFT_28697 [Phlebiopsis gigantea 11061_1 CR5-6]|uniref:Protein kinase regulator n=1 Tax=Phlebiopsis gigantea (strain 11061_1 CR5-6) TaxID=745531 RepID=A0A0C3SDX0_PHLG1|nr:hypothetical protein PHLGIDRAFT_28697 [Phlebiopsis gigantea 11061_1 CR5-6]